MLREQFETGSSNGDAAIQTFRFRMVLTTKDPPGMHTHELEIDQAGVEAMMTEGISMDVETDEANGHSHALLIRYDPSAAENWVIMSCDGRDSCWDEHDMHLELVA